MRTSKHPFWLLLLLLLLFMLWFGAWNWLSQLLPLNECYRTLHLLLLHFLQLLHQLPWWLRGTGSDEHNWRCIDTFLQLQTPTAFERQCTTWAWWLMLLLLLRLLLLLSWWAPAVGEQTGLVCWW